MLAVNMLIKWQNDDETSIERILWLDPQSDLAFVIDVGSNNFPFAVTISEIEEGINEGFATILEDDPFLRIIEEDKLSEKERQLRDRAWNLIGGIVTLEPHIYYRKERAKYVKAIAEKNNVSVKTIGNYLKNIGKTEKQKMLCFRHSIYAEVKGKRRELVVLKGVGLGNTLRL